MDCTARQTHSTFSTYYSVAMWLELALPQQHIRYLMSSCFSLPNSSLQHQAKHAFSLTPSIRSFSPQASLYAAIPDTAQCVTGTELAMHKLAKWGNPCDLKKSPVAFDVFLSTAAQGEQERLPTFTSEKKIKKNHLTVVMLPVLIFWQNLELIKLERHNFLAVFSIQCVF